MTSQPDVTNLAVCASCGSDRLIPLTYAGPAPAIAAASVHYDLLDADRPRLKCRACGKRYRWAPRAGKRRPASA